MEVKILKKKNGLGGEGPGQNQVPIRPCFLSQKGKSAEKFFKEPPLLGSTFPPSQHLASQNRSSQHTSRLYFPQHLPKKENIP